MKACQYEIWNKKTKEMQKCGHEAKELIFPNKIKGLNMKYYLCEEHRAFVIDAYDKYSVEKTKAEMKNESISENKLF